MIFKVYTYRSYIRVFFSMKKESISKVLAVIKYIITALIGYLGGNVIM